MRKTTAYFAANEPSHFALRTGGAHTSVGLVAFFRELPSLVSERKLSSLGNRTFFATIFKQLSCTKFEWSDTALTLEKENCASRIHNLPMTRK